MDRQPNTLCLIDGSGYIFRAFYALPPITRPDGTPVGAVFGFTKMLMNLIKDNPCSHMCVVFDAKRHNFRNDIYKDYKANRKETPPELIPQFPMIRQATEAFSIPYIELEGFEADDLIATYARIAPEQGMNVRVISADKDLMQLIKPNIQLFDPMKKKPITLEDVQEKFGVTPDKVVDVQALMGDASDNIPGAKGVGPKTASALINEFGSLDNLLANLDKIPQEKRRDGLKRDVRDIEISRKLASLDEHAPVPTDLSPFQLKLPDAEKVRAFLTLNDFKSLMPGVTNFIVQHADMVRSNGHADHAPTLPTAPDDVNYELIQEEKELARWIDIIKKQDVIFIDTETTGFNIYGNDRMVGFSLSDKAGNACYVPVRHGGDDTDKPLDLFTHHEHTKRPKQVPVKRALALLAPVLANPNILKVGHNIKFDLHVLAREYGNTFVCTPVADTMLMSYSLDGAKHGHGLDELALLHLHHANITYEDVCGTGKNKISFDQADLKKASDYAAEDADITGRLYHVLKPKLDTAPVKKVYDTIDNPMIPILFNMERAGILVDRKKLQELENEFGRELDTLTKEIHALAGETFNINSPAQLGVILYEKRGLSGGKKSANGAWVTDSDALERLSFDGDKLAQKVLDYRGFSKLKSTYVDALSELAEQTPRIHTTFSLTGTNTGRLASSNPNLQNIPIKTEQGKRIREAFIAKPGYKLISADYSQIELRLLAEVADVRGLKQAFDNKQDIHAATASQVFGIPLEKIDADTRRRAKAINFGIVYGISPFGLANQLGISRTEAGGYIDKYFEKYPEIRTYMARTIDFAATHEYVLTPFGRRCYISGFNNQKTRGFAERAAINAPMQGGAADIIKMAMIDIARKLAGEKWDATLLLQIHDELIFEVKNEDAAVIEQMVKQTMEGVVKLSVPLEADVGGGHNWREAH